MTNKPEAKAIKLLVFLTVCFFAQGWMQTWFNHTFLSNHLLPNYLFNFFFTLIFCGIVVLAYRRLAPHLGYAFLFSSMLKFLLFLTLLYPSYKLEFRLRSAEFAGFFVPYAVCLVLEVLFLVKRLKSANIAE